ncbi:MAG: class I SAM-dependent methyltransferase [Patescibacteria group bacterium]
MRKKKDFWDKQYKNPTHLELSDEPAEDLQKFCRYLVRNYKNALLNVTTQAVDIGCGNGRNLIYLAREFGMRGIGYDTSKEGVAQANAAAAAAELPQIKFLVQDLRQPIPLPDNSVTIVLDMMASHILKKEERDALMFEMLRVLRPNGWVFFKSFILDEDQNAARMLREHPGPEENMYIHPELGHAEYVWTVGALRKQFGDFFTIHKIEKSHKHRHADGSAWKRRTVSVYLEKTS